MHDAVQYTCPMHPQIVRNNPGCLPDLRQGAGAQNRRVGSRRRKFRTAQHDAPRLGQPDPDHLGRKLVAHSFRHTFATRNRKQVRDVFELMEALGHTQLSTTKGYLEVEVPKDLKMDNSRFFPPDASTSMNYEI